MTGAMVAFMLAGPISAERLPPWVNSRNDLGWPPDPRACSITSEFFGEGGRTKRELFGYDEQGRLISHQEFGTSDSKPEAWTKCSYQGTFRTCSTNYGETCTIEADNQGRRRVRRCNSREGKVDEKRYEYDSQGVERSADVERTYDDRGRLVTERTHNQLIQRLDRFRYDSAGRRIAREIFQLGEKKPREVITYLWDREGRLSGSVDRGLFSAHVSTFTYDAKGRLTTETVIETGSGHEPSLTARYTFEYDSCKMLNETGPLDCQRFGFCR